MGLWLGCLGWRGAGGGCSSMLPHTPASFHRQKLLEYLHTLKQPDGSFLMHVGGEVDVRWVSCPYAALPGAVHRGGTSPPFSPRSAYCAAAVASLTNILTPALFTGTAEWIAR